MVKRDGSEVCWEDINNKIVLENLFSSISNVSSVVAKQARVLFMKCDLHIKLDLCNNWHDNNKYM